MIKLFVSDNDVTNGTVGVTWCISHETLDELSKREMHDPQLVICVAPSSDNNYNIRKEYRKIVPLKDLMTYVEFRNPGKNKIWAFISATDGAKSVKRRYLERDGGIFATDILTYEGGELVPNRSAPDLTSTPIEVDVPKECFAPEPSEWEKAWVNHWFYNKPVDQCNFRRRRLLAYTIQPIAFLLMGLAKTLLLLIATLIGARGWSLKYLLHPLTYEFRDSLDVFEGGSIFIRRLPEDSRARSLSNIPYYLVRKLCLLPFTPLVMILIALSILFHVWLPLLLAFGMLVIVMLVVFSIAEGFAGKAIARAWHFFAGLVDKIADNDYWYLRQEEIDMIVCDGSERTASVSALPAKKRTIALRFSQLKSKVCRPFSA